MAIDDGWTDYNRIIDYFFSYLGMSFFLYFSVFFCIFAFFFLYFSVFFLYFDDFFSVFFLYFGIGPVTDLQS